MIKKINMKPKRIFFRSVILILVVSILTIIASSFIVEKVVYTVTKPYFYDHLFLILQRDAKTMSKFLSSSNNSLKEIEKDKKLCALLSSYFQNEQKRPELAKILDNYVPLFTYTGVGYTDEQQFYYESRVVIVTENGDSFYSDEISECANQFINSDWYRIYLSDQAKKNMVYTPIITVLEDGVEKEYFGYLYYFDVDDVTCYSVVFTDLSQIISQYSCLGELGIKDYAFLGTDNELLYSSLGSKSKIPFGANLSRITSNEQYMVMHYEENDTIDSAVLMSNKEESLRFVVHTSKADLLHTQEDIYMVFQLMIVLIVILLIVIDFFVLRRILSRLKRLSKEMEKVKNGDYNVTIDDNNEDEISELSLTFNMMTDKIRDNICQIMQQEKNARRMQYNLMVSAIDPHFIYNTLNTVSQLAAMGRMDDVVTVNDALIGTLKDRMKMKGYETFDTVESEKRVIEDYIVIQNYLCSNTIELNFYVSDDEKNLLIPKNVLQLLIENAIIHGILLHKDENGVSIRGKISVSIWRDSDDILFIVEDNGVGMDDDTIEKYFSEDSQSETPTKSEHMGIYNIKTRLRYLYGDNYSIEAKSILRRGTTIKIRIPSDRSDF